MSLSDVSTEVTVANTLRSLCDAGGAFQSVRFQQASLLLATAFMSFRSDGQTIVRLRVAIAACQRYAEARLRSPSRRFEDTRFCINQLRAPLHRSLNFRAMPLQTTSKKGT